MTRVDLASILASICVVLRRSCKSTQRSTQQVIDLIGQFGLRRSASILRRSLRRSCDAPSQAIDLTGEIDLRRCVDLPL